MVRSNVDHDILVYLGTGGFSLITWFALRLVAQVDQNIKDIRFDIRDKHEQTISDINGLETRVAVVEDRIQRGRER